MAHRRRGGQWVELDPELSEPMLKIVQILRELVDCSGLRLKGVQQLLLAEHQSGPRPPSYHGLSQRLRGEGLQNNAWLIHLIIETLAPQERKEVLTAEVSQHLLDARAVRMAGAAQAQQKPTQETATPELLDVLRENRELHKEAEQLRRRLERKDKDLRALRHKLAAAETRVPSPRVAAASRPAQDVRENRVDGVPANKVSVPVRPESLDLEADAQQSPGGRSSSDAGLRAVEGALRGMPNFRQLTARALRRALDSVLDGGRTGRFDVKALGTAEKVYISTKITHEIMGAWGFRPGAGPGLFIKGEKVTLKATMGRTWAVAPDELGTLCLLVSADDQHSRWSLGLLRIGPEHLIRAVGNRDGKRMLSASGRQAAMWFFQDQPLPENTLLQLPAPLREEILVSEEYGGTGRDRTHRLFKLVQGRAINHTTIRTVAMTQASERQIREARSALSREGILVFGREHAPVAHALGLPVPHSGEWVSQRVTRLRPDHGDAPSVLLSGEAWTKAEPDDPIEEAPVLPTPYSV